MNKSQIEIIKLKAKQDTLCRFDLKLESLIRKLNYREKSLTITSDELFNEALAKIKELAEEVSLRIYDLSEQEIKIENQLKIHSKPLILE